MIDFFYEDVAPIGSEEERSTWLEDLIHNEGKKPGKISYIFCDDEYLLEINRRYLEHDYYTDIITFDYCRGKIVAGDIFVSLQRVKDNAKNVGTDYEHELNRVLAHGILHLCGYPDKTPEQQEIMRSKENFYLEKY